MNDKGLSYITLVQPVSAEFSDFGTLRTKPVAETDARLKELAEKESVKMSAAQLKVIPPVEVGEYDLDDVDVCYCYCCCYWDGVEYGGQTQ